MVMKNLAIVIMIQFILYNRFMENVAFDLPQYYPPVPLPPYALGEVNDLFSFSFSLNVLFCLDSKCGYSFMY